MPPILRPETEAALAAVRAALELVVNRVGADIVREKGPGDYQTDTDVASEDAIRRVLEERLPGAVVIGEERGGTPQEGKPYWLVDPICGTTNFVVGLPFHAVNLALVEDGEVTASVVGDGSNGNVYLAQRGEGAWQVTAGGLQVIHASEGRRILALDAMGPVLQRFAIVSMIERRWNTRIVASTVAFLYVATGTAAAYLSFANASPVHTTAGAFLALEAGATVTDYNGQPWTVATQGVIAAATPEINAALVAQLATVDRRPAPEAAPKPA